MISHHGHPGILAAFVALLIAAPPAYSRPPRARGADIAKSATSAPPLAEVASKAALTGQSDRAGQADQAGQANFTLDGKISKVATGRLTVDSGGHISFDVTYDAKTKIWRKDGTPGSAADLRVGKKVHVVGDLNDAGDVVAARIDLQ